MELTFYIAGILCAYSYFIYPVILKLLPVRRSSGNVDFENFDLPKLSLIITVHNEAARIGEKLENTGLLDYPANRLDVIVASDFSTDETETIVESYADKGVRLVRADERKGKEYAQLCAIRAATGEILVFSDVATRIPADALKLLAVQFADSQVGALSSEDQFISNDGGVVGEGAYVKYEMWLRRLESDRAGLVGLSGSFFAARREVCEHWDINVPSDFNTALNSAKQGLVAITCPNVVGMYKDVADPGLEYRRKIRTVIRGITAIARHPEVLNPFGMGMFAFQVWSHKIMRWGVPWFMAAFLILTLLLQGQGMIYTVFLIAQLLFYGLALAGWAFIGLRDNTVVKIIFFFVQTNLALAQATVSFIFGKRMTVWTPSKR
ncbi:Glycosyl transferase, group 2 family [hydrothermal vent metagenome]|uniref:Glycosyl transferase, group 2 family n=1 Tax=hydrothermal vent metagenome TaxID=652676 RepID=A0A3B0X877_9ZZZZ